MKPETHDWGHGVRYTAKGQAEMAQMLKRDAKMAEEKEQILAECQKTLEKRTCCSYWNRCIRGSS